MSEPCRDCGSEDPRHNREECVARLREQLDQIRSWRDATADCLDEARKDLKAERARSSGPYRRFAIRFRHKDGGVMWWTDDGTGCDDARDYTEWGTEPLVTYITRGEAIRSAEGMRNFAHARSMTVAVVPVWEYPDGVFELKRRPTETRPCVSPSPPVTNTKREER